MPTVYTEDGPMPTVAAARLTPGQYKSRSAYRIDPLLAAHVEIVQPDWQSRSDDEIADASGFWKDYEPGLLHRRTVVLPQVLAVGQMGAPVSKRMSIAHRREP